MVVSGKGDIKGVAQVLKTRRGECESLSDIDGGTALFVRQHPWSYQHCVGTVES